MLESYGTFGELSQSDYLLINGGGIIDGLITVAEGAILFVGGAGLMTAASGMTGTTVLTAALVIGTGFAGIAAGVCGVVVVGYGIYKMFN